MLKRLLVLPLLAAGSFGITEHQSIGIGGLYSSSKATNANVKDSGIYLNFRGDDTSENHRTKVGAEFEYGYGTSKTSGSLFSHLDKYGSSGNFSYLDIFLRFGFNAATKEVPLFINLIGGIDGSINGRSKFDGFVFARSVAKFGLEVEGALPLGQNLKLTYSAAYLYTKAGYRFGRLDGGATPVVDTKKPGYDIIASVGFITNITPKMDLYVKAKGKYRTFGESKGAPIDINGNATPVANTNYPASRDVSAMLEVGIGF